LLRKKRCIYETSFLSVKLVLVVTHKGLGT